MAKHGTLTIFLMPLIRRLINGIMYQPFFYESGQSSWYYRDRACARWRC